jgi:diguanylate cyclase (GGDEF)-like protein/PAS domain S-box-containing protein
MVSKHAVLRTAVPAELREWADNRLISAHTRIVKSMVLGGMLNAALIVVSLFGEYSSLHLALFFFSMLAASLHRLWLAEGIARGRRQRRPEKMLVAYQLNSLWLGLTFAGTMAFWLPDLSPGSQILLAICGVTQIASAAYTVRTLPRSATIYVSTQALGLTVGLAALGSWSALAAIAVLLAASGLLIRMAFVARDLFITRIMGDRELAASARTVRLLLNEYEESGSNWLFELDRQGQLTGVSARFAEAFGASSKSLEGRQFETLFEPGHHREALSTAMAQGRALRDDVLPLAGSNNCWWSVSGRPCYHSVEDKIGFRGVISDVTSQYLAESRVHHMAHYDALTGLPNRALFNQSLGDLLDESPDDTNLALLLLDVDHFKSVNDMFGHPTGDAFLRAISERISATVEDSGLGGTHRLVSRLGGDEFAIIVSGDSACDHGVRLAERLIEVMLEPMVIEGHELANGVSIGIALAPYHAELKQQLVSNADMALYAAKNAGRGTWEMFEPGMDAALHERHALTRDLRHAVARGELRMFLQPLVDVASEAMTGYEALLRWEHPTHGMVMPDTFIPLAEETGLIVPIGEWVIRTALSEAASWDSTQTIAINLSPVQLDSPNLLPVIINALAISGIDPARVEFEITESVLLHNSVTNIAVLNRLHDLGVKIALDDFGTGYASLNYLLTFPFDKIKIDRSFISGLSSREDSRAIVGAVISLANQLGMCTLAEGVEDAAQLASLREHGCQMVQGWLFGKAEPSQHYHPVVPGAAKAAVVSPLRRARKAASTQTYSRRAQG